MLKLKKVPVFLSAVLILLVLAVSASADSVILNDLNAEKTDISSYKGKAVLLFFWTTWCPYCREEIIMLNRMAPQMQKEGMEVFAVNVGEADNKVFSFVGKNMLTLRVLLDRDGKAADNYDVIGVPTYIILDKAGKVALRRNSFPKDYKSLLKD
ncbi:MAG: TlpA disulfide reductase family protein [Candidatus Omnitrophica bacterium]|nr:TlpA disulfide reductase family protein [Candidatus Omnitrophota bacterium]